MFLSSGFHADQRNHLRSLPLICFHVNAFLLLLRVFSSFCVISVLSVNRHSPRVIVRHNFACVVVSVAELCVYLSDFFFFNLLSACIHCSLLHICFSLEHASCLYYSPMLCCTILYILCSFLVFSVFFLALPSFDFFTFLPLLSPFLLPSLALALQTKKRKLLCDSLQ